MVSGVPRRSLILAVFLGGCVGGLARYVVASGPWSILAINLSGAFVLAFLLTARDLGPHVRAVLGSGFCGAFTTYSGVVVPVARDGGRVGFLAGSVLGGLAAAYVGVLAGRLARKATAGRTA